MTCRVRVLSCSRNFEAIAEVDATDSTSMTRHPTSAMN